MPVACSSALLYGIACRIAATSLAIAERSLTELSGLEYKPMRSLLAEGTDCRIHSEPASWKPWPQLRKRDSDIQLRMFIAHRVWIFLAIAGCLFLAIGNGGCQLMIPDSTEMTVSKSPLKPIVEPRDVIDIEVFFVDRHIGDPLIGDSLWSSLFPISSLENENRQRLTEDGFRCAMSPSRPPRSLQSLFALSNDQDPTRRVIPRRYTVPSGQETLLMISSPPNGTPVTLKHDSGTKQLELNDSHCLLRLSAKYVEEGWVNISLFPEIRHGANALRAIATNEDWQFREQQQSIPLYQHRLSADLNVGEVIILGLEPNAPDSLASRFFRADLSQGIERLILIRVLETRQVKPVRETTGRSDGLL